MTNRSNGDATIIVLFIQYFTLYLKRRTYIRTSTVLVICPFYFVERYYRSNMLLHRCNKIRADKSMIAPTNAKVCNAVVRTYVLSMDVRRLKIHRDDNSSYTLFFPEKIKTVLRQILSRKVIRHKKNWN